MCCFDIAGTADSYSLGHLESLLSWCLGDGKKSVELELGTATILPQLEGYAGMQDLISTWFEPTTRHEVLEHIVVVILASPQSGYAEYVNECDAIDDTDLL